MIEEVGSIKITKSRWSVHIEVNGKKYIATADSAFTDLSGIWFGTEEEYNDHWDEINGIEHDQN